MGFGDTWDRDLPDNKEVGGLADCCVPQMGAALA
jgi:hypothetical protein